jgi:hypothetical protein
MKAIWSVCAAAMIGTAPAAAQTSGPIDPARLSAIVKELASEHYQGRAPGGPGEAPTVAYLSAQMKALGLEPAMRAAGPRRCRWSIPGWARARSR